MIGKKGERGERGEVWIGGIAKNEEEWRRERRIRENGV
jgi:hypothetical protein